MRAVTTHSFQVGHVDRPITHLLRRMLTLAETWAGKDHPGKALYNSLAIWETEPVTFFQALVLESECPWSHENPHFHTVVTSLSDVMDGSKRPAKLREGHHGVNASRKWNTLYHFDIPIHISFLRRITGNQRMDHGQGPTPPFRIVSHPRISNSNTPSEESRRT